jgi:hypothetical protein
MRPLYLLLMYFESAICRRAACVIFWPTAFPWKVTTRSDVSIGLSGKLACQNQLLSLGKVMKDLQVNIRSIHEVWEQADIE